ncbi:hypothetical protein D3C87_1863720 [compost metagenome]
MAVSYGQAASLLCSRAISKRRLYSSLLSLPIHAPLHLPSEYEKQAFVAFSIPISFGQSWNVLVSSSSCFLALVRVS